MTTLLSLSAAPKAIGDARVVALSGREALSEIGEFRIAVRSDRDSLPPEQMLGAAIAVDIDPGDGGPARVLSGVITAYGMLGPCDADHFEYEVYFAHALHLATLTARSRIFQNRSPREIVESILGEYGSDVAWKFELQRTLEPRLYCTQFGETDFQFIARLMAEEGVWFAARPSQAAKFRHEIVFADTPSAYVRGGLHAALAFRADDFGEASLSGWSSTRAAHTREHVLRDYDYLAPSRDLKSAHASGAQSHGAARSRRYVYPGRYLKPEAGRDYARLRMELEEVDARSFCGGGGYAHLSAGAVIKVDKAPAGTETDECVITRVEHTAEDRRFSDGEDGQPRYRNTFFAMPARMPFRPRLAPRRIIPGPQTAVVTGPSGADVHVDEHMRIKVQFHWDLDSPRDENSSCYLRVVQAWAGGGFGAQFIPRIGMEVLVDFIDGDCDRPIVVGCVYNGLNRPPFALSDNKTVSGLRSVTSPSTSKSIAQEMKFEDKPGGEETYFYSGRDFRRVIDNDDWSTVGRDQTEKIRRHRSTRIEEGDESLLILKGDRSVKLDAGQSILEAAKKIELKVGQTSVILDPTSVTIRTTKLLIDAKAAAEIKAVAIKLEARALLALSSRGALTAKAMLVNVNANAMLTLKGGIVLIN